MLEKDTWDSNYKLMDVPHASEDNKIAIVGPGIIYQVLVVERKPCDSHGENRRRSTRNGRGSMTENLVLKLKKFQNNI